MPEWKWYYLIPPRISFISPGMSFIPPTFSGFFVGDIPTKGRVRISLCFVTVLLQLPLESVPLFQVFKQHRQWQSLLRALITEKNIALRRQRYLRLRAVRRRHNSWKKLGRTSLWWDRFFNKASENLIYGCEKKILEITTSSSSQT